MYDELVKELRDPCPHENCVICQKAADAIEDLEFACNRYEKDYKDLCAYLPKWIPVTERLPSYGDWVLGIGPKNGYHVCEYRGMSHFVYGGDSPWFSSKGKAVNITHWMPLSEPPKEG